MHFVIKRRKGIGGKGVNIGLRWTGNRITFKRVKCMPVEELLTVGRGKG